MSTPLSTTPAGFKMGVTETLPLGFDTTALLASGQSPTSPVCVLTNVTTGKAVTLADSPTINGNVITQIVRGPTQLVVDDKFVLAVTFTAAANTIWTMVLVITVPAFV